MVTWFRQLDRILRGEATRLGALRQGQIDLSVRGLAIILILLGMLYGLCMGIYSVIEHSGRDYRQALATTVKVPLLFFLTLLVTFPSLYVFNALVGSRLTLKSVLRLLIAAMGVMLTVLASFGTIVAFFSVSTKSYPFMLLLNVVIFGVSGFLGLAFLLQTLHRLTIAQEEAILPPVAGPPAGPPPVPPISYATAPPLGPEHGIPTEESQWPERSSEPREPGALDATEGRVLSKHVKTIFKIWVVVFGLVGAQMAWVLRPFIGSPGKEFSFFRARESNFFEAVWQNLGALLGW